MWINSVPDVNAFVKIKMCYVHNQWYDTSCATLYIFFYKQVLSCAHTVTIGEIIEVFHADKRMDEGAVLTGAP